jgi:RimJ/RimL family protein N-acetyltransferase
MRDPVGPPGICAPRQTEQVEELVNPTTGDELPLQGRKVRLVPLRPDFVEQLYVAAATNAIPWQWHGPETPHHFQESLWANVLVQFAVEEVSTGRPVGFVRADHANLFHGFAYFTLMIFPEYRMRGWTFEAPILFANYVFRKFNLQNLYAEMPSGLLGQVQSGIGTAFELEGRMRNRVVVNGERQDLCILTLSRERAMSVGAEAVARITRSPAAAPAGARSLVGHAG